MEILDIVDEKGNPTGKVVERSLAHAEGIRHRTAHIWVVRKMEGRAQVLLQKRSMHKDSFPGQYDTSSSGHIQAGDEPRASAIRELSEELGIKASEEDLKFAGTFDVDYERVFYGKLFKDKEIAFVYVYDLPVSEEQLVLQEEEVDEVRWFDVEEVAASLNPRDCRFCVPSGGFAIVKNWCEKHFMGNDKIE